MKLDSRLTYLLKRFMSGWVVGILNHQQTARESRLVGIGILTLSYKPQGPG